MFVTPLPREDYIAGNSVFEEFAIRLHLLQAILHIREVPIIVIGRAEEKAFLRREEFLGAVFVFQHLLASADEVIHIFRLNKGIALVVHLADSVVEVVEDEIDLAEVRIVFLISHFDLLLDFLLQLREVDDTLRVDVNLEFVVLGDERTEFLHESEVPLVIYITPILVGLQLFPSIPKGFKEFFQLVAKFFFGEFVHLVGEVAEIIAVGLLTFKGYLCVVKINVESDRSLLFCLLNFCSLFVLQK